MKKFFRIPLFLVLAAVTFAACEGQGDALINERLEDNPPNTPPTENYTAGTADFSNYIAIGNSMMAGFMDGALYNLGQQNSIPALIAGSLDEVGGPNSEEFEQPDINSVAGFNTAVPNPHPVTNTVFGRFKLDTSIPGPSPTVNGETIQAYTGNTSTLNNFGVPGIKVAHLLTPLAADNPFYGRFASAPGSSTILGDALSSSPTFFSLWIGNNDVLGYARGGAADSTALTAVSDFQTYYQTVVSQLMAVPNLKGVATTIPNVLAIPFFQAISHDRIELDEATADQLNTAFAGFNAALDAIVANMGHDADDAAARKVSYAAGANPILIFDKNLEDLGPKFDMLLAAEAITPAQRAALAPYEQARPITENEIVLMSAATVLGTLADETNPQTVIGVAIPLGDQYALTSEELIEVETARQTFNAIIQAVIEGTNVTAGETRIALHDINDPSGLFADAFGLSDGELGLRWSGVNLSPDFSPNGIFSTDGIHPNARGNALVANEMLEAIEEAFNAVLPEVNVLNLPSVQVCSGDCASQLPG